MKKIAAHVLASLFVLPVFAATAVVACSSDDSTASTDGGTDSSTSDVVQSADVSVTDVNQVDGSPGCNIDRPSTFTCSAPTAKPGESVCDDAAIDALVTCFGTSADSVKCAAAKMTYTACAQCMITDWQYESAGAAFPEPDTGACMQLIDPGSMCGKAGRCTADCYQQVCGTCSIALGSGKNGGSDTAQYDCEVTASRTDNECLNISGFVACANMNTLKPCIIFSDADFTTFFRGACRDNGNWTNALNALDGGATDAGDAGDGE